MNATSSRRKIKTSVLATWILLIVSSILYNYEVNSKWFALGAVQSLTTWNDEPVNSRSISSSDPTISRSRSIYDELLSNDQSLWDSEMNSNGTKIVWQTWITRDLPSKAKEFREAMMANSPTYDFRLVTDDEMNDFMKLYFENTPIYEIFSNTEIGAVKADLWRYCVLYVHGGVYLDMDSGLNVPLDAWVHNQKAAVSFEKIDWQWYHEWCFPVWERLGLLFPPNLTYKSPHFDNYTSVVQWLLVYPQKRNPVLRHAILLSTYLLSKWQRIEEQAMNVSSMHYKVVCMTGPGMYTIALMRALHEYSQEYLRIQLLGIDYEDYANFRCPFRMKKQLTRQVTRYDKLHDSTRITTKKEMDASLRMSDAFLRQPTVPQMLPD